MNELSPVGVPAIVSVPMLGPTQASVMVSPGMLADRLCVAVRSVHVRVASVVLAIGVPTTPYNVGRPMMAKGRGGCGVGLGVEVWALLFAFRNAALGGVKLSKYRATPFVILTSSISPLTELSVVSPWLPMLTD